MGEAVFIVVPAYNEAGVIADTVRSLRVAWPKVVVVDDGSEDGTGALARAEGASVLRHAINRGQGAALQTGIEYSLGQGAEYIVTFDADGQHSPQDIERLLAPLIEGATDAVLASRFLRDAKHVPLARRGLLRLAVLFTRWSTGLKVTDTHNGLRAFNRKAAMALDIRLDGMAHASEILDQIAGHGLRWQEVAAKVTYTEYSQHKGQRSTQAINVLADYLTGKMDR